MANLEAHNDSVKEIKNSREKEKIKAESRKELNNLKNKIEEDKINKEIDESFNKFCTNLMTSSKPDYKLRADRNISLEKLKNKKVRINSYWETCEIDLNSGLTSYIKWNKSILLGEIMPELPILDKSWNGKSWNFKINKEMLNQTFWQINVINKAVSMAKKSNKKEFSFWNASFLNSTKELKVDWNNIISVDWLRKWFLNWMIPERWKNFEKEFVSMLDRITK